jgi:ATP-binding cassette subfamily C (CFTR/MRP) protein 1
MHANLASSTQFLETVTGLTTIRAFEWVDEMLALNYTLLDDSQRPAYLLSMIQQWLAMALNLMIAGIAVLLVALATQLRASSGFTGVGLMALMSFGEMLSSIVRFWTQFETAIGAVSRLKSLCETIQSESLPEEIVIPPESWPSKGAIEMGSISASYGLVSHSFAHNFPSHNLTV